MTTGTLILLAAVGGGVALIALSAVRNRVLARISLRNVTRRRSSAALVVLGSMVGTAMIAGSLAIGDSFRDTAHHEIVTRLGEIDQIVVLTAEGAPVTFPRGAALERADAAALNAATRERHDEELVDGVLPIVQAVVPVAKVDRDGEAVLVRPQVAVVALDPDAVARFGEEPPSLPAIVAGEAIVSRALARELDLAAGDLVRVHAGDDVHQLTVAATVPEEGLTGYRAASPEATGVVGPLLVRLEDGQAMFAGGGDDVNALLVSHRGGVLDAAVGSAEVREALGAALDGLVPGAVVYADPVKERFLDGSSFIGIMFAMFSTIAIAAGIMLTVTVYTMLAEERRTEMGILRAVSVRRGDLVRLYTYEGLVYSLIASVVGVITGLGVGAAIIAAMNRWTSGTWFLPEGFTLSLRVEPASMVVAGAIGLVIAMVTVLAASHRLSRINVVAAMRDLPDPPRRRRRVAAALVAVGATLLGAGLTALAVADANGYLWLVGPPLLALGIGGGLRSVVSTRAAMSVALLAVAVHSQAAFEIQAVIDALDENSAVLMISGLMLVFATIGLVALNLSVVLRLASLLRAGGRRLLPVLRVALAYPASRPGRTGMTLGMFALVVYAVVLVATIGAIPRHHIGDLGESVVGGFDAVVVASRENPVSQERLAVTAPVADGRVTTVSAVRSHEVELPAYRQVDFAHHREEGLWDPAAALRGTATVLDDAFLLDSRSRLAVRDGAYATDADAWAALAADPSLVILDFHYSGDTSWDPHPLLTPGETVALRDPVSGEVRTKTVIGRTTDEPFAGPVHGIMMSAAALGELRGGADAAPPSAFLLRVADGADVAAVATEIERELVTHGAQVEVVAETIARELGALFGFLRIWQGFLAFGLVVGIAGLGVLAARSVHQRHREIGMLRALGLQRSAVTGVFLAESSVVAVVGILVGVASGSVSGYFLSREMWRTADLSFVWPAAEIAALAVVVYLAAIVFTVVPARRAAALAPVDALRAPE